MSTWCHQFWLFSYKTAKYWGRGPRVWTPNLLAFGTIQGPELDFSSESPNTNTGIIQLCGKIEMNIDTFNTGQMSMPGCALIMHLSQETFDKIDLNTSRSGQEDGLTPIMQEDGALGSSRQDQEEGLASIMQEDGIIPPAGQEYQLYSQLPNDTMPSEVGTWENWPESWMETSFTEILRDAFETNNFSTLPVDELPISVSEIVDAADSSQWFVDSLSFAIMAGNERLVYTMLQSDEMVQADLTNIFPFHLAVTYLDGTKVCCQLFHTLMCVGRNFPHLHRLYVNDLGHTVLDRLMVTILKSHTKCPPKAVEDRWIPDPAFPGAEVDVCGRWDADSESVRILVNNGQTDVPFDWKHHFCHTSVQTICHCIRILFAFDWSPDINHPSGLFRKYCSPDSQMGPLHTLVMTAAHLVYYGCQDEDLFGIIACALCLLSNGANPYSTAQISLAALQGQELVNACIHEELTPAALADRLTPTLEKIWSNATRVGWEMLCYILNDAPDRDEMSSVGTGPNMDCMTCDGHRHPFGRNEKMATLWAIMQAEVLAYRRNEDDDGCHSDDFDMRTLLESVKTENMVSSRYLEKNLLKSFCRCGRFNRDFWINERIEDVLTCSAGNFDKLKEVFYISDVFDHYFKPI
jgi:hypothetical protein